MWILGDSQSYLCVALLLLSGIDLAQFHLGRGNFTWTWPCYVLHYVLSLLAWEICAPYVITTFSYMSFAKVLFSYHISISTFSICAELNRWNRPNSQNRPGSTVDTISNINDVPNRRNLLNRRKRPNRWNGPNRRNRQNRRIRLNRRNRIKIDWKEQMDWTDLNENVTKVIQQIFITKWLYLGKIWVNTLRSCVVLFWNTIMKDKSFACFNFTLI